MNIYVFNLRNLFRVLVSLMVLLAVTGIAYSYYYQNFVIPTITGGPIFKGNETRQAMALTINVDWGEEYLPGMLDTLAKKNVKATFFLPGRWAGKFSDLALDIAQRGHEIGNHGYAHDHPNALGADLLQVDIQKAAVAIKKATNVQPRLFAPAYGEYNSTVLKVADDLGYETIMWTLDTIDWQKPSPEVILNRIVPRASNGAIILMHPTKSTSQALPQMINQLKQKGYKLETVSKLIYAQ